MKKVIITTFVSICTIAILTVGCKKSTDATTSTQNETTLQNTVTQNSTDHSNLQNDDDALTNDVTKAAGTVPTFNGLDPKKVNDTVIDGAQVDKSPIRNGQRKLFIRYHAVTALGVIKDGVIAVELEQGNRWFDSGAVLKTSDTITVTYNNVTRVYQSIRYVTNLSGFTNPFIYKVRTTGTVKFEDGSVRDYWIARKNTYNSATYTFTSDGDSTVNGMLSSMGGVTRFGKTFVVQALQTYISNLSCNYFRNPISGIRKYISDNVVVTITFGVDNKGNQVTNGCAWGYMINWTKWNGTIGTAYIQYW